MTAMFNRFLKREPISCLLGLLIFSGCTAMGVYDGEQRFLGIVDSKHKISRAGEPSKLLYAFGAVGGLLHYAASGPTPTNFYSVKTAEGTRVSATVDEEFAVGDCVEVIPANRAVRSNSYVYGDARIVRSDKCVPGPNRTS